MLWKRQVAELISEAHDSQVTRMACRVYAHTRPSKTFPPTAKAADLSGCGDAGKACTLAFSYGTESDPTVAATFMSKLTRTIPHTHVPLPPSSYKTILVPIPIKTVTYAFTSMPKKYAPYRDGWTWRLFLSTWRATRRLMTYYVPSWNSSLTTNYPSPSRSSSRSP